MIHNWIRHDHHLEEDHPDHGHQPREEDGLLELDHDGIALTPVGRYLVRNVCMVFDAWLPQDAEDAGPRYSRTV